MLILLTDYFFILITITDSKKACESSRSKESYLEVLW